MKSALKIIFSLIFLAALGLFYLVRPHVQPLPAGVHYAINGSRDFYEAAYSKVDYTKPAEKIYGITVNHHLLAPNLIAQEFALVATDKPITVALVSPNHFYRGDGGLISSESDWQTPYGNLETDRRLIDKLKNSGLLNTGETPFEQEHGINGLVGFIKKSLPNARFVPIIVKENLPDEKADELAAKLAEVLPADALVVGSLDFSHYLTSNGAAFHDIQTLAAIHNFDYDRIKKLDIDSHPGLRLLLKYFDHRGARKFVVTSHENSSTATGNYSFVETTSYIDGYFVAGSSEHDNARTVIYVQGLSPQDHWKTDAADRLYKYNDEIASQKPQIPDTIKLPAGPLAVGLVYNPNLTDIYLFPLDVANHLITLQRQLKPATMHLQIK